MPLCHSSDTWAAGGQRAGSYTTDIRSCLRGSRASEAVAPGFRGAKVPTHGEKDTPTRAVEGASGGAMRRSWASAVLNRSRVRADLRRYTISPGCIVGSGPSCASSPLVK